LITKYERALSEGITDDCFSGNVFFNYEQGTKEQIQSLT